MNFRTVTKSVLDSGRTLLQDEDGTALSCCNSGKCSIYCSAYHESESAFEPYKLRDGSSGGLFRGGSEFRGAFFANCLLGRFTIGVLAKD
jgi:hypothetical protein